MHSARRLTTGGVWALTLGLLGIACGHKAPTTVKPDPQVKADNVAKVVLKTQLAPADFLDSVSIWRAVDEVALDCGNRLGNAASLQAELKSANEGEGVEHPLVVYNKLLIQVDRVVAMSDLVTSVHPDKEVRAAAEKCRQRAEGYLSALRLDRGVYNILQKVDASALDDGAARFHKNLLRDYRRAGVDKDDATRAKLSSLKDRMVQTGQDFSRNIREGRRVIEVTKSDLAGMPDDFIQAHQPGKNGKIELSTDYPDIQPILAYASKEKVRRELWKQSASRAYPENESKLRELLEMRMEYATLLGYPHWADYETETKMIKNGEAIGGFLNKIAEISRQPMIKEREEMLARKQKDDPQADSIRSWDRFYYVNKIRQERYKADAQEVRKYLPFNRVKEGMLKLAQQMFDLQFKKVETPVWHESVEAYEVLLDGEKAGNFFLDMHPRKDKYGHAAMFQVYHGVNGAQLPAAALVCNFPEPKPGDPALMEHGQVGTMFHEFGHLMHHLLAGRQDWQTFSGVQTEWDFVEVPSQVLEEWVWDVEVLQDFAMHHETGEKIPAVLIEKLRLADDFGKGVHVMRQLWLASMSYQFHKIDITKIEDLNQVAGDMAQKYSPYPFESDTHYYASFGHLEGYSVMYYTYMWSLMLAKDILSRFKSEGLLNPATTLEYRQKILEPGGSRDAEALVSDFLGRAYSFDEFATWLSS